MERLPCRDGHRKIPGGDQPADADGLSKSKAKFIGKFARRRLAVEPSSLAGRQFGHIDGFLNIAEAFHERLAAFAGDKGTHLVLAARHYLACATNDPRALRPRG